MESWMLAAALVIAWVALAIVLGVIVGGLLNSRQPKSMQKMTLAEASTAFNQHVSHCLSCRPLESFLCPTGREYEELVNSKAGQALLDALGPYDHEARGDFA